MKVLFNNTTLLAYHALATAPLPLHSHPKFLPSCKTPGPLLGMTLPSILATFRSEPESQAIVQCIREYMAQEAQPDAAYTVSTPSRLPPYNITDPLPARKAALLESQRAIPGITHIASADFAQITSIMLAIGSRAKGRSSFDFQDCPHHFDPQNYIENGTHRTWRDIGQRYAFHLNQTGFVTFYAGSNAYAQMTDTDAALPGEPPEIRLSTKLHPTIDHSFDPIRHGFLVLVVPDASVAKRFRLQLSPENMSAEQCCHIEAALTFFGVPLMIASDRA